MGPYMSLINAFLANRTQISVPMCKFQSHMPFDVNILDT